MWVAKFKAWHKESVALAKSRGINAVMASYYLNAYEEKGSTYISKACIFIGPESEKLTRAITEDPRVILLGNDGKQLFYSIKINNAFHSTVMDRGIFFIKPILVRDGFEYWTVAAWKKENLTALYDRIKKLGKRASIELLSMGKQNVNLFLPSALSDLTEKQRAALEISIRQGYYDFPRKASLEEIAKKAKTPRTTFQNHLRHAEGKAFRALLEKIPVLDLL